MHALRGFPRPPPGAGGVRHVSSPPVGGRTTRGTLAAESAMARQACTVYGSAGGPHQRKGQREDPERAHEIPARAPVGVSRGRTTCGALSNLRRNSRPAVPHTLRPRVGEATPRALVERKQLLSSRRRRSLANDVRVLDDKGLAHARPLARRAVQDRVALRIARASNLGS